MMNRAVVIGLVIGGAAVPARASTIEALSPARLYAEADRVVDGTVIMQWTAWNATHTGFETTAVLGVSSTLRGVDTPAVEVTVPGGTMGEARHVIVGMPSVALGERARWFLRDRGDGKLAVYGWAQGKWPARQVGSGLVYEPAPLEAERRNGTLEFTTNGMVWPAAWMPIPYLINDVGSADLPLSTVVSTIDATFATWQDVPCASLTFTNAGMTGLGMAVDGNNVMLFIESGWVFGTEAAAATSLFIIDGMQTADIAMNGERFTWAIGPSGALFSTTMDLQGVLTHEIGHFSGLGHTMRAFDTMYYSWTPWQGQRRLSIDDKLGLCSIYPVAGSECPTPACPPDENCTSHPLGMLCEGTPDSIGTPCNYDRIECEDFCLFIQPDLSDGYCSKFCDTNADCPPTHHCDEAMAGMMTVKVCFAGAQPLPDAGPAPPCVDHQECPVGQYCGTNGVCTFDCRTDDDCAGTMLCSHDWGWCEAGNGGGGCGCRTDEPSAALLVLGGIGFVVLRRRRRPRRGVG